MTLCALNAKTLAFRKDARAMTAVHQKVSSSLLAPDTQPGDSPAEQRRSSSPNPLYRICPAFNVRRPLCEGYLFKQSHQNEVVFNKRYFALYPDVLVYYKSQADCEHDKEKNRLTVSPTTARDGHCPYHPHPTRATPPQKRKQMEFHLAGLYLTKPDKKPRGCKFCWILHIPDPKNTRR